MIDLDTIVGSSENLLPTQGFWGFLLEHWLAVAITVMVLGFVIDQVLYIVRYRPQEKLRKTLQRLRIALGKPFGVYWDEDADVIFGIDDNEEPRQDRRQPVQDDAPVIRRGGAQYAPVSPRPVPPPVCIPQELAADEQDEDAPTIVRAAQQPARALDAEPSTQERE